jgi:hypothetical protein
MSDHPSDDELCEDPEMDEEELENMTKMKDPSAWCVCGVCTIVENAGTELYSCNGIERVERLRGDSP